MRISPKPKPFVGVLAERIVLPAPPLILLTDPAAEQAWLDERSAAVFAARLGKIEALARHYGQTAPIAEILNSPGYLLGLLISLAIDFVPGFQYFLSGSGETIPQPGAGRPRRDPEFLPQLLRVIDVIRAGGLATTDDAALEVYVDTHRPDLAGVRNTRRRAKHIKSLKNLLAAGRAGASRKAARELQ
jgi:hypothetical protein